MRGFAALVVLALLAIAPAAAAPSGAPVLLHLLDYISVDYAVAVDDGEIINPLEYDEMREFAAQARTLLAGLPPVEQSPQLIAAADALVADVAALAAPAAVAERASALRWAVIDAYGLAIAPNQAPDLEAGAALYQSTCAACHGAEGHGDGPAGAGLDPAPSDFHDRERMSQRSVFGLYNTITLGVDGTGMASYRQLDDDQRWALAFHVANYAADDALRARGEALWSGELGLDEIATLSADEIGARHGDDAVAVQAYLRANPALAVDEQQPLEFALAALEQSLAAYRAGDRDEALRLAVQGYLEGFELAEASLQALDSDLMLRGERALMDYRALVREGAPLAEVAAQAEAVRAVLAEAETRLGDDEASAATVFTGALIILLREGGEAILVIAAMLAILSRAGRADARRWIHAGWLLALAAGVATWFVSSQLIQISGANREITEGVTALLAAAILLYVGYWLHSKSNSAAWQRFIGDKVGSALSNGTLWTLALVAFLAVYREAFETVLFFQALAAHAGPGGNGALAGGALVAAALLVVVAWAILRASVRLPIGRFFAISGVLLMVLAVVFTGQGTVALQEAGYVDATAVPFPRIDLLGVYPTVQTLSAQLLTLTLSVILFWRKPDVA